MVQRVIETGEISINELPYRLGSPARFFSASQLPQKYSLGARTKDDEPFASVVEWSDWRGGIGVESMDENQDMNRAWWSECNLRHKGHLILPPLVTASTASDDTGGIDVIGELGTKLYVAWANNDLVEFDGSSGTGAWTQRQALDADATDILTARLVTGGVTIIVATTSSMWYATAGDSWAQVATSAEYLAFWDNRLWAIDNTGQLRYLPRGLGIGTAANWVVDAQLPLPNDYVNNLFVGPDAAGETILYAATRTGLYAHDAGTHRFVLTGLVYPYHRTAGRGSTTWRGDIYLAVGVGVYRYSPLQGTITVVGPDLDDGLETTYRGRIQTLIPSHNMLLGTTRGSRSTDYALLLGYDGKGWQVLWVAAAANVDLGEAHISDVSAKYRLYWAYQVSAGEMYYMDLQRDALNPKTIPTYQYEDGPKKHYTPWVRGVGSDNLALSVTIGSLHPTTSETIDVAYSTNGADSWTAPGTWATITSSGDTTYYFPDSTTAGVGVAFNTIRFRIILDRGTTEENTPDMLYLKFTYIPKRPPKWGVEVDLNLYGSYKGRSTMEQLADLRTAAETVTLVEVTIRDDQSSGDPQNYFMVIDPGTVRFVEESGLDQRGIVQLRCFEP